MRLHEFSIVVLQWLWQTTWQAALLAVVIGSMTRLMRRWVSPGARQALWLLVFLRLMMPFLPASRFSIWSLYTQPETKSEAIEVQTVHYSNEQWPAMTDRTDNHSFVAPPPPSIFEYPQTWLAILWAAGAMLVFGYTIVSTFRFAIAVRRTARQPDETTAGLIKECLVLSPRPVLWERVRVRVLPRILKTALNRDRTLTPALSRNTGRGGEKGAHPMLCVIVTDKVATPALFGVFRPKLLLPLRITSTLDPQSLRNVVLHELEHLKRHHLAMDWLLTAVRAVHWFNPAAWWAHRQIRAAREFICDQAVIAGLSDRNAPQHYGNTLLTIAGGALRSSEPALVAAFARDQKLLRERIETIARFGKKKHIAGLGLLLMAMLMVGFLTKPSKGQDAQQAATPTTVPTTAQANSAILKYPDNWPNLDAMRERENKGNADNPAVYAALDRKLPEVRLNNVAFTDVIDYLRKVSGAEIYVNWRAIQAAGVDRNALVSATMKEVKFSKVLDTILKDVGGGNVALTYTVDQGVITISTENDLSSNVITRVYDVRDLVGAGNADAKQHQDLIGDVIKLIEDSIAPNSWKDRGGAYATIRELPGTAQLIITQTPENQQKLHAFLDQLREKGAMQIHVKAQLIELPSQVAAQFEQQMDKDAQVVLDDKTVGDYITTPGSRVIQMPSLTLFNGQQAVINTGSGEGESSSFRIQTTISQDHKFVTVVPWITYSPNSRISAEERQKLDAIASALNDAQFQVIQLRTTFGTSHPSVQKAQVMAETLYNEYQEALHIAQSRMKSNTDKPAEQWVVSAPPSNVPDGGTLLVRYPKHSIVQITPDGSTETLVAPPGDKVIWLLIRPTIIIQREKEQEQFPLLQK